jgi:hypothetical protein
MSRERAWDDSRDCSPTAGPSARRRTSPGAGPVRPGRRGRRSAAGSDHRRRSRDVEDEIAAVTDLAIKLGELRDVERRMALEEKARAAFLHGAEEHSRATRTAADAGRARETWRGIARWRDGVRWIDDQQQRRH